MSSPLVLIKESIVNPTFQFMPAVDVENHQPRRDPEEKMPQGNRQAVRVNRQGFFQKFHDDQKAKQSQPNPKKSA